jgi:hypothetical protein
MGQGGRESLREGEGGRDREKRRYEERERKGGGRD